MKEIGWEIKPSRCFIFIFTGSFIIYFAIKLINKKPKEKEKEINTITNN